MLLRTTTRPLSGRECEGATLMTSVSKCSTSARPGGLGPADFTARANDAACQRQPAADQKAHGDGDCMPATGGQPAQQHRLGCFIVQMERPRIELTRKLLDLCFLQQMLRAGETIAGMQVVQTKRR